MERDALMVKVKHASIDDVGRLLNCLLVVWESLRGMLPNSHVDHEVENLKRPQVVERMRNSIQSPQGINLLAEEDAGSVIGVAMGNFVEDGIARLGFLGVIPTYRRKGIGSSLLRRFQEEAEKKGAHKVFLFTAPSLQPAIRLYLKEGFVPEGFLRNHYHHQDFIIYSKFLPLK